MLLPLITLFKAIIYSYFFFFHMLYIPSVDHLLFLQPFTSSLWLHHKQGPYVNAISCSISSACLKRKNLILPVFYIPSFVLCSFKYACTKVIRGICYISYLFIMRFHCTVLLSNLTSILTIKLVNPDSMCESLNIWVILEPAEITTIVTDHVMSFFFFFFFFFLGGGAAQTHVATARVLRNSMQFQFAGVQHFFSDILIPPPP